MMAVEKNSTCQQTVLFTITLSFWKDYPALGSTFLKLRPGKWAVRAPGLFSKGLHACTCAIQYLKRPQTHWL